MDLSIVVPLYNEEGSVEPLYRAITDALDSLPLEHGAEILFVDDGSSDTTFACAERLALLDRRLRVVKFRRNFGQTSAMAAGIDLARGTYIVTMDGDLQNDPRDIGQFIAKLEDGFDVVVGWRFDRQDKLVSRKIPSRIANWLIGKVTGVPIRDNGCSLKGFRSGVIKNVPLYSEMHRFIPAMASMAGARIAEIKVRHHARQFGRSKYGLSRVYKVLFDLLMIRMVSGFAARPLAWFALLALPFFLLSTAILTWQVVALFVGSEGSLPIAGAGIFFAALCFFLLFSGVLAELINRTGDMRIMKASLLTATERRNRPRAGKQPLRDVEFSQ
ncbi:MAG TPA: glycosyltransferase family 2 protein [Woeseiaceae bacterium]